MKKRIKEKELVRIGLKEWQNLPQDLQQEVWKRWYDDNSDLKRKIKKVVYSLLVSNYLYSHYEDVLNEILFKTFKLFIGRLIENRYDPVFLEKAMVFKARWWTIEIIKKLKKENMIDENIEESVGSEFSLNKLKMQLDWKEYWNRLLRNQRIQNNLRIVIMKIRDLEEKITIKKKQWLKIRKLCGLDRYRSKKLLNELRRHCVIELE